MGGKAEPAQNLAGPGLERVAAEPLKAVLSLPVALKEPLVLARGLGNLMLHLFDAGLEPADLDGGVNDLAKRAPRSRDQSLLLEVAKGDILGEAHRSLVCALLSHDDPEEGRLTGAIRTDEPPALSCIEL